MAFDWFSRLTGKDAGGDKSDADSFSRMLKLTHAGRAALAQGHARQALELLSEKHKLVVAKWGKDAVFSATSAIDLADAFLACGKVPEADRLTEWAVDRYRTLGIDDERYLRALSKLAMSAYQAADYQRAESRFVDLISRYKAIGSQHDVDRAMAMDHLAQVYMRQQRSEVAEPLLLEALAIFERDGSDASATAVCLSLLARLRYMSERYREAEQLQRRAIASHEAAADEMSLAKELDHLGATLSMRAQSEHRSDLAAEAVTHGERAVAIFERYLPADHYSLLGCKQNLGKYKIMSASIGKMFPSGGDSYDDPMLAMPEGHPSAIVRLLEQSWRLCQAHDYARALGLARDARHRAIQNFGDQSPLAGSAVAHMIGILRRHCSYLLGEPTGTLSPLESFMMQMRANARRGIVEDEMPPAPNIGPDVRAGIERLLQQGIAIVDEVLEFASSDLSDARSAHILRNEGFSSDVLEILHCARWLGILENDAVARLAFDIMQLHGDVSAAQGLTAAGRHAGESAAQRVLREDYRLAVLERDTLVRSLVEAKDRADASSAAARSAQLPALEQKAAALQRRLQEESQIDAQPHPTRLALDDARAILLSNEAIVAAHVGGRAIFLIAVRPQGTLFKRVEIEGDLVRAMCEAVVKSATLIGSEEAPDFDLINALQIHDLVFHPLRDFLQPLSHLLVLADGPLWTLPLGCLVVEPMGQVANEALPATDKPVESTENEVDHHDDEKFPGLRERTQRLFDLGKWLKLRTAIEAVSAVSERGAWLADRYSISMMPSLTTLKLRNRVANRPDNRRAFLGIGDPLIGATANSDHDAVPETRSILTDLAAALGGDPVKDVVAGSAATIDRLIDLSESGELAGRHVICFATHAIYPRGDGDLLTDAGLLFSQGEVLTAFDVAGLRIDADFVLLTACFTGSPSGRSITVPLSGLAQAFLTAGACCLLVSHWPVEVRATELFVRALAAAIGNNTPLADALAAAEKQVRHTNWEFAHPAFWAGFSIIGDGAKKLRSW
jgi:tetratricopeptide (TPR) repeat protein